jgi:hypothetical protein
MHQAVIAVDGIGADAFAMKAGKERCRAGSVKASIVVKNANLQTDRSLFEAND